MEPEQLRTEIDWLLRNLKACDTQASAVQWMKRAYLAMEGSMEWIGKQPTVRTYFEALSLTGPPVFVRAGGETPRVVLGPARALKQPHFAQPGPVWFNGKTTVYGPELHEGIHACRYATPRSVCSNSRWLGTARISDELRSARQQAA